eukprot:NODE_9974_length_615_cov_128.859756_g9704_i0.p1 GENE.NODE_9974_length_615_cov_128.859756_g9704_i0~~NODE_9974_length_615_cov_128.859756_g9704_i0.p1  ORF type:complete len:105 (+),score=29.44 NODE_9974_length_615_cov_128.859756_g9704_i0:87-401(+)
MSMQSHTIVLTQVAGKKPGSRTYADFETLTEALDGVVQMYEQLLKQENPQFRNITYDITDLLAYMDSLGDLSCLVWNESVKAYKPYGRQWLKERVYQHLRKQAS